MTPSIGGSADVAGLVEEARCAERAGRFGTARRRYEAALHLLGAPPDGVSASGLLRWIGRTHEVEGDLDAAFDCYEAAQATAEATGSHGDLAHVLNCHGILMFRRGRLDEAQALYDRARAMAERAGAGRLVAMVDQNLGNVANVHGDHELSLGHYQRSRAQYEALGLSEYVGPLLTNIGRVHIDLEQWDAAATTLDDAERVCAQSDNVPYQVLVSVQRTRLHLARGEFWAARDACEDAMELSLDLGEDRWLGEIHMQAGVIYHRLGRPALAERRFQRAVDEADQRAELLLTAEIQKEMAHLFHAQGRNQELLQCLFRAHEAFESLRARRDLAAVGRQITALEQSFEAIVQHWGESIESADRYTGGHCERVADLACLLADTVGLDPKSRTWFRMGALLHDVGKVDVPEEILNKRGPLDAHEWEIMKRHPRRGVELLADVEFPWDIRPMVLHHHERWDGTGYPCGLAGDEIPLAARLLCVADVFDALTTTRSYRRAFSGRVALEIMSDEAGHVFDPEIFAHFREVILPHIDGMRMPLFRVMRQPGHGDPFERRPPLHAVA